MSQEKSEFRNTTDHLLGVVLYDQDDKQYGGIVHAGETVWLSEKERIATANAPKLDADNPLANGNLVLVTEARDIKNRRPIGEEKVEEAPAAEETEEETEEEAAVEGETAVDEEVATPEAKPLTAAEEAAQRTTEPPTPRDQTAAKAKKTPAPKGKRAPAEVVGTPTKE